METIQWKEQWRPIEVGAPAKRKSVLVKTSQGRVCLGRWDGKKWYWTRKKEGRTDRFFLEDIVAWAPQPSNFWENYGVTPEQLPVEIGYPYIIEENHKLEKRCTELQLTLRALKKEYEKLKASTESKDIRLYLKAKGWLRKFLVTTILLCEE